MQKHEEVSNAEILASIVCGTGKAFSVDVVRPISYRIPVRLLARIDALADKSGKSRNYMITNLIELGLDELDEFFNEEQVIDIHERTRAHMNDLMGASDIQSEKED
jgi:predicted DNA-binding protein